MKGEETRLAVASEVAPLPSVEQVRLELARARAQFAASAAALKSDFGAFEKVRTAVKRHPYLALGAAFAVGLLLALPGRKK